MINTNAGTPFIGYCQLTNGAPGPTNFTLFSVMGQAAYTLQATERLVITNITVSSNDTQALTTVDTGGTTPTPLMKTYLGSTQPPAVETIPPGCCHTIFGVVPRATASAVTGANTVQIIIKGFLTKS
jgi:hypothetical protein